MMTLRDPTLLDVLGVCLQLPQDERDSYRALTGAEYDPETAAVGLWATEGPRWCISDARGTPLVVCGYARMQPGVFRSWYCATGEAWSKHGAEVTRLTRDIVSGMLSQGGARRLETVTLACRSRTRRWYDRLGLRFESTLQGFGVGGEAAVMYVALRDTESG